MTRYSPFTALVLVALAVGPATAQDTDETEEPDRWSVEVGFALNSAGGNEELTVLTSQVGLTHLQTSAYEASLGGRFRYGRSQGEDVAQNLRGDAIVDLWPEAGWSPFVFASAESDPFKKLDLRLNSGTGVKRTFWKDDWEEVSLSGAVLYSYENLEREPEPGADDGISQTARWSWRGRGRAELGEGRRLEQVVFYQPVWDTLDDYLLEAQTSARWSLTRSLAFTTAFLYQRDSTPAPDVGPDDWSLAIGLSLATGW